MSVTIKAFLEKEGKQDGEIRRFPVPADVSSSYAYLSKKIASIFPSLREDHFSTYWRDPDGDYVAFSTDEELCEALGFVSDGVLKVYVRINEGLKPAEGQAHAEGEVHPGVVCDGCETPVKGVRFKCMVCPDYDLCQVCEGKGLHSEHNMVKIMKPGGLPSFPGFPPNPRFWGPPPRGPFGPQGPPPGHPRPGEPFAPPPHFRRWMKKFMRRWHNKNSPGCSHDDKDDSPDDQGEEAGSFGEDYLKCVGESVASMLDPMGIDVHVDIEHDGRRQCQFRGRGRGRGGRGGSGRWCPWRQGEWKAQEKMDEAKNEEEPEKKVDETEKSGMEGDKVDAEGTSMEKEEVAEKTMDVELIKEVEHVPSPMMMDVQRGNKDEEEKTENQDTTWTFVTQPPVVDQIPAPVVSEAPVPVVTEAPAPMVTPAPAPAPQPQVQFQMPPQIVYPPSNPRVAEALQQMMAMGFNNDGGWLTRLLEAKNGDIIQVLDAIKPQPGRSHRTNGGYMA